MLFVNFWTGLITIPSIPYGGSVGGVVGRGGGGAPAAAAAAAALPDARQRLTMGDRCACATGRPHQGRRQLLVSWTQATSRRPSVYHYHTTNVLN